MVLVDCKKCNSFQIIGYITSIDKNYSELCKKCYMKEYYKQNKETFLKKANNKYYNNKEDCLKEMKKYAEKNKEKLSKYYKEYYQKNYDKMRKGGKEYYEKNKKILNKKNHLYKKALIAKYPYLRTKEVLSSRIRQAIMNHKGTKKSLATDLLGADIHTVRKHIEKQFTEGMTWENHSITGWHIDHIIPCETFNLLELEQQKLCFHYTNLQPLWCGDNIRKGTIIED